MFDVNSHKLNVIIFKYKNHICISLKTIKSFL